METIPNSFEFNQELFEEYRGRLASIILKTHKHPDVLTEDALLVFIHIKAKALEAEYGKNKTDEYALYHVLSGSTQGLKKTLADDFPGDDSVASFIKLLEERF